MSDNWLDELNQRIARGDFPKEPPDHPAFRTDEQTEIVGALEKLAEELERAHEETYEWKWAIVALHNAAQAACVVAVSGTDQAGALKYPEAERQWLRDLLDGKVPAKDDHDPHLASFLTLIKRAQSLEGAKVARELDEDMRRLNTYRNYLIHYVPRSWVLLLLGTPEAVLRVLDFIESILPGTVAHRGMRFIEEENEKRATAALVRARAAALALQRLYEKKTA